MSEKEQDVQESRRWFKREYVGKFGESDVSGGSSLPFSLEDLGFPELLQGPPFSIIMATEIDWQDMTDEQKAEVLHLHRLVAEEFNRRRNLKLESKKNLDSTEHP